MWSVFQLQFAVAPSGACGSLRSVSRGLRRGLNAVATIVAEKSKVSAIELAALMLGRRLREGWQPLRRGVDYVKAGSPHDRVSIT